MDWFRVCTYTYFVLQATVLQYSTAKTELKWKRGCAGDEIELECPEGKELKTGQTVVSSTNGCDKSGIPEFPMCNRLLLVNGEYAREVSSNCTGYNECTVKGASVDIWKSCTGQRHSPLFSNTVKIRYQCLISEDVLDICSDHVATKKVLKFVSPGWPRQVHVNENIDCQCKLTTYRPVKLFLQQEVHQTSENCPILQTQHLVITSKTVQPKNAQQIPSKGGILQRHEYQCNNFTLLEQFPKVLHETSEVLIRFTSTASSNGGRFKLSVQDEKLDLRYYNEPIRVTCSVTTGSVQSPPSTPSLTTALDTSNVDVKVTITPWLVATIITTSILAVTITVVTVFLIRRRSKSSSTTNRSTAAVYNKMAPQPPARPDAGSVVQENHYEEIPDVYTYVDGSGTSTSDHGYIYVLSDSSPNNIPPNKEANMNSGESRRTDNAPSYQNEAQPAMDRLQHSAETHQAPPVNDNRTTHYINSGAPETIVVDEYIQPSKETVVSDEYIHPHEEIIDSQDNTRGQKIVSCN